MLFLSVHLDRTLSANVISTPKFDPLLRKLVTNVFTGSNLGEKKKLQFDEYDLPNSWVLKTSLN